MVCSSGFQSAFLKEESSLGHHPFAMCPVSGVYSVLSCTFVLFVFGVVWLWPVSCETVLKFNPSDLTWCIEAEPRK